jgi:hypothetical protein
LARLQGAEHGKIQVSFDSDDETIQRVLNLISQYQEGTSMRYKMEGDLYKFLYMKSLASAHIAHNTERHPK